jgi:hypothetical protein
VPTLAKPKATVEIQARLLEALKVPAKARQHIVRFFVEIVIHPVTGITMTVTTTDTTNLGRGAHHEGAETTTVPKKPWVRGLSSLPLARWNETCTFRYIPLGMPLTTEPVVTVGVRLDTKPSFLDYTVPPTEKPSVGLNTKPSFLECTVAPREKPSGTEESQERNTELQSLPSTWLSNLNEPASCCGCGPKCTFGHIAVGV